MTQKQESPTGDGGAFGYLAGRLDASEYTRSPHDPQALAGVHFERQIMRVHALGPRPLAEMLGEIATATGQHVLVVDLVEEYAGLDAELVRFLGADRFAPMPLEMVR